MFKLLWSPEPVPIVGLAWNAPETSLKHCLLLLSFKHVLVEYQAILIKKAIMDFLLLIPCLNLSLHQRAKKWPNIMQIP